MRFVVRRTGFFFVIGLFCLAAPASFAAAPSKTPWNAQRARAEQTIVEDLFETGHDFCERGEYELAVWPLRRAAELARNDAGPALWFAHAMIQVGMVKEGKGRLASLERSLSTAKRAEGSPAAIYLACVRNYLGAMSAQEKAKPQAAGWFDRASAATPSSSTGTPPADGDVTATTLAQAELIRKMAAENKKLLESGAALVSWVPPTLPPPKADARLTNPGLAARYIRATDERWRTMAGRTQLGKDDRPTGSPRQKVRTLPVPVQLLDAAGALNAARCSAAMGNLNEAVRLAEAARTLKPDMAEAMLLLADLYEAKNWLVEATEALREAAGIEGNRQAAASDRIEAIAKEHRQLPLEPRGLLTSRHFRMRFSAPPAAARAMLLLLEQAHQAATSTFAVALPVVYVRLFPDRRSMLAYAEASRNKPPPDWLAGYATISSHTADITISAEASLGTLSHEYAHLVVHTLAGPGDLPGWLNEGIAEVVKLGRQVAPDSVRNAFLANQLPTPESVEKFFRSWEEKRDALGIEAALYYDTARGAASFLLNSQGDAAVLEWLLMIRRGMPARDAFAKLFGCSWDKFFATWAETCLR